MRIFITGGTGQIGVRLIRALRDRGDEVVLLSRQPSAWEIVGPDVTIVVGDPMQPGDWQKTVGECDGVINLAGANIFGKRWSAAYKQLIAESRLRSTTNVVQALTNAPKRADGSAKVLVSGSAIGYYGFHGDEILTEKDPAGSDYLAVASRDWESAAFAAEPAGVRVACIRIGVVLDARGGAIRNLMTPYKLGVGGPVGSGRQYMSWIHHADIVGIILLALDNPEAKGPINGTAPAPVTNKEFAKAFGAALGRPSFLPTPAFALRAMLGEVATLVTRGQRVEPAKALALGYQFQFPDIGSALREIVASAAATA